MALIKLGGLAQDVRGSLVGTTFSRNRAGAYVRGKVSPCQPLSSHSGAVRGVFSTLSQVWASGLSAAQRSAWGAWATLHPITNRFGDSVILSGVAAFQYVNALLYQSGQPYIKDVPLTFHVDEPGGVTVTLTTGSPIVFSIAIDKTLLGNEGLIAYASARLAPGRMLGRADLVSLSVVKRGCFPAPAVLTTTWALRFPNVTPIVADRIGWGIQILNKETGARSSLVTGVASVVAP
jgi:hypothetical protein